MYIHLVRKLTDKYKRGGRVVAGHMAKLSLLPPAELWPWHARSPIAALPSPCCR
jgi:hypothetical protein